MPFQPVGPKIKVKIEIIEDKKSAAGIIIETAAINKQVDAEIGEVVELGHTAYKDLSDETPWCKVGDRVLFQKHAGKIDPSDQSSLFRYLRDIDVIAVERK